MRTDRKTQRSAQDRAALLRRPSLGCTASVDSESWIAASLPRNNKGSLRELARAGVFHSGLLRLAKIVSRRFEFQPSAPGVIPRLGRTRYSKYLILCYHGVGENGIPVHFTVPTTEFEEQIQWLGRNYRLISMNVLLRELQEVQGREQAVVITFDDGYRNAYTDAFPILAKYRVPATVFLTVGAVESGCVSWYDRVFLSLDSIPRQTLEVSLDRPRKFVLDSKMSLMRTALESGSYLRKLPDDERRSCCARLEAQLQWDESRFVNGMLTWGQVRAMARSGISFGSHTLTHPVLDKLSAAEMEHEIGESKRILEERLELPVKDFAFPFGKLADCGSRASGMLTRLGYRSASTTMPGVNSPGMNPFELRRVSIGGSQPLARFAYQVTRHFLDQTPVPTSEEPPAVAVAAESVACEREPGKARAFHA